MISGFCASQYGRVWEWRIPQEKKQLALLKIFWGDTYDSSMDLRVPNFQSMIWAGWWGKSWRNGPYLSQALLQARCTSPKRVSELQSNLVGGFNPSKKYESQLGWLFQIYGKPPTRSVLDFCRQICYCLQSDMAGNQSFAIHTHLQINSGNPIINHPHHHQKKMV